MKPDIIRLHGADVHERCPSCGFIVNRDACAMGCNLTRCKGDECGELIKVGGAHECPPQAIHIPNDDRTSA